MNKICDQEDCPLYNKEILYHEVPRDTQTQGFHTRSAHSHSVNSNNSAQICGPQVIYDDMVIGFSTDNCILINQKGRVKIKTKILEADIECLFCEHKKQFDMKSEIICSKAKSLLQGENNE